MQAKSLDWTVGAEANPYLSEKWIHFVHVRPFRRMPNAMKSTVGFSVQFSERVVGAFTSKMEILPSTRLLLPVHSFCS